MRLKRSFLRPRPGAGDSRTDRLRRARGDPRAERARGDRSARPRRLPPRRQPPPLRPNPPRRRPRPAPQLSAAIPETDKYAAVAAVPAVLTNCTPSGGDTAWMLTSVALVLMMTIPGLGLFYGGMVRKKNVGDTVMTAFAITCAGDGHLRGRHVLARLHRRNAVHRRPQPRVPARHPQRRQQRRHRQSEPARADDPRDRLHVLPDDLRDHHARADRRRLRGAHEVLGHAVVHRPVGDPRLRAGRALAVGARRHLQLGQSATPGSRFSTSPAARSFTSTRASRVSSRRSWSASAATSGPATTWS